jgi:isoquinoline 1-oxidoreductase subunit beta
MPELRINGERHDVDADLAMPPLWGLREPYRSVCDIPHAFAAGSCVDELAAAGGKDPLQFLLSLLDGRHDVDPRLLGEGVSSWGARLEPDPIHIGRLRNVLLLAAARSGWRSPLPARQGRGIAVYHSLQSYVAAVARVAVAGDGTVSVPRIDLAVDCGRVMNRDRVVAAFEGAAVMSVDNTLCSSLAVKNSLADPQVPRMDAAPDAHVYVVRSEEPPGGVGEPGVPPVAVAIANAIFATTGQRVRTLPVDPDLLRIAPAETSSGRRTRPRHPDGNGSRHLIPQMSSQRSVHAPADREAGSPHYAAAYA